MKEEVILIKTIGGEFYIGYTSESDDNNITLNHVRNLSVQMTPRGMGVIALSLIPFSKTSPETITLKKEFVILVVSENDIEKGILDNYKTQVTGIQTVSKPDIII